MSKLPEGRKPITKEEMERIIDDAFRSVFKITSPEKFRAGRGETSEC